MPSSGKYCQQIRPLTQCKLMVVHSTCAAAELRAAGWLTVSIKIEFSIALTSDLFISFIASDNPS